MFVVAIPSARGRRLQEAIVSTSLELLALEAEFLQFVVDGCMVVGRLLASSDACCMLLLLLQAVASGEGKVDTVLRSLEVCVSAWKNRTVFQENLSVLLAKARPVSERWFALPELGLVWCG